MKRLLLLILITFTLSVSARAQQTIFVPICSGTNDTAAFTSIVNTTGSNDVTIRIPYKRNSAQRCAVNTLTLPARITLDNTDGSGIKVNTGQTLTVAGARVNPPGKTMFYNVGVGQGTVVTTGGEYLTSSGGGSVLTNQVGYVCTNTTADAAGLQAAINSVQVAGGKVKISGACNINTTIDLTPQGVAGAESYVSLEGDNPVLTKLTWTGSTSGWLLRVSYNKFFKVSGIGFYNGGAKGTTRGIQLIGPNPSGTQTLLGIFERIIVSDFDIGIQAGAYTGFASSEILYLSTTYMGNNTAWKNADLNTLNHKFEMLGLAGNGIGLDVNSGNASVDSGSASNQTVSDFALSNAFASFSVRNFYSETQNRFLTHTASGAPAVHLTIENVRINNPTNADKISIHLGMGLTNVTIDTISCAGKIWINDVGAQYAALDIRNSKVLGDASIPIFYNVASASVGQMPYTWTNVWYYDETQVNPSYRYENEDGGFKSTRRYPTIVTKKASSNNLYDYLQARLKSISYGTLSNGNNMRLQETFAGAGTKAVTFIRNITVSTSAGSEAVVGPFTIADQGKKIVLAGVGGSGGNVTGFIYSILGTQALVQSPTGIEVTSGAVTATIGEDEPDPYYMLMLGCNADERFSWSPASKAATGFTLVSSNAASTATCDIMIVR